MQTTYERARDFVSRTPGCMGPAISYIAGLIRMVRAEERARVREALRSADYALTACAEGHETCPICEQNIKRAVTALRKLSITTEEGA